MADAVGRMAGCICIYNLQDASNIKNGGIRAEYLLNTPTLKSLLVSFFKRRHKKDLNFDMMYQN